MGVIIEFYGDGSVCKKVTDPSTGCVINTEEQQACVGNGWGDVIEEVGYVEEEDGSYAFSFIM